MRILLADSNHPVLFETLEAAGMLCDHFWEKPAAELIQILPSYDGLVIRSKFKINKEIINACPNLKCIGRVGAGMENIDVSYATSKGIVCLCVPEGNKDAVGEHTIGMLLMLLNNLKKADDEVRKGIWIRTENRGFEIMGKTVGIIGYGNMGEAFAEKLRGFGCRILAHDKYKTGFGNKTVKEASLAEIFETCDFVSLHLPFNEETNNYFNAEFLKHFKKPIYVLNTARGKCLNTEDLVAGLKSGKVKGACLDVLEYESVSFENIANKNMPEALNYLISSDKVVLSPHIAGWTHESNYKMSLGIAQKMIRVLLGN
jgi:D-3-phosphoglycerate dehydrogenase